MSAWLAERLWRWRYPLSAIIVLVACDKTIPGGAMGLIRTDVPGFVLYGGSIAPGKFKGCDVTIQDLFEAVGANARGEMTNADFKDLEDHACPGAGACGGNRMSGAQCRLPRFAYGAASQGAPART